MGFLFSDLRRFLFVKIPENFLAKFPAQPRLPSFPLPKKDQVATGAPTFQPSVAWKKVFFWGKKHAN